MKKKIIIQIPLPSRQAEIAQEIRRSKPMGLNELMTVMKAFTNQMVSRNSMFDIFLNQTTHKDIVSWGNKNADNP